MILKLKGIVNLCLLNLVAQRQIANSCLAPMYVCLFIY